MRWGLERSVYLRLTGKFIRAWYSPNKPPGDAHSQHDFSDCEQTPKILSGKRILTKTGTYSSKSNRCQSYYVKAQSSRLSMWSSKS